MRSPRRQRALVAGLISAYLAVQLLLPSVLLFGERPARFGWQMYSTAPRLPVVVALDASGGERRIDIIDLVAGPRAEIDYAALMAQQGCDLVDASRLRIESAPGEVAVVDCP